MATWTDTRKGSLAALVCLVSACIPSRDNPHDPAVAPTARLAIVFLADFDPNIDPVLQCGDPDIEDGLPIAVTASRGACLALDARATKDKQGGEIRFTYFVADSAGRLVSTLLPEDTLDQFLVIPPATLRSLPRESPAVVRFGVTAVDKSGAKSTAFTAVVLTNTPPSFPRPSTTLLPVGGFPWARGFPMQATLDGRVPPDPDGDELGYCWSTSTTEPDACDSLDAVWQPVVPTTEATYAYQLVVNDGLQDSEQRTFVVRVGLPPLWATGDGLRRFDETLRVLPQIPGTQPWLGRGAGGEEWMLLYDPALDVVTIHRWPDLTLTAPPIALGAQSAELIKGTPLPGGGMRIWIAARTGSSTTLDLHAYNLNANGTVLTFVDTRSVSNTELRAMAVDVAGNVAVGGVSNPAVLEFVSATLDSAWTVTLPPGTTIEGGAAIPETTVFSMTASGGKAGNAVFVYEMQPEGPPTLYQILDGFGAVRQLEYFDNDRFWASSESAGLTFFERSSLTRLATFPDILDVRGSLHIDPGTGACHLATLSSLITVDVEGRERRYPIESGTPVIRFVDADGRIAVDGADPGVLRISRTLDPESVVSLIDVEPVRQERAIADGGVWAVTAGPAIVHLAENGATLDYFTELSLPSGDTPLVAPIGVVDPDGRAGWFVDFLGASEVLYRVDFVAARTASDRLPAVEIDRDLGYYPIGASSPTAAEPFAWLWDPNGGSPRYATIDIAGNLDPWLSLPGESTPGTGAVVSPVSNDLCVFSQVGASTTLKHRRVSPAGVVTSAGEISVTSGAMNLRSPFTSSTRDECGVVAGTGLTHLFVWGSDGALHSTHDDADPLVSMTAVADGVYWGTGSLDGLPDERILTRILVQGTSGVFSRETFPLSLPGTPVFLP